jgi:hypothetical protein
MNGVYRYIPCDRREVVECDHWDDIPQDIAELIAFKPEIPPEPHTAEEHEAIEALPAKLREIMARCRR